MSAIALLMGLLLLSFVGSLLVGEDRRSRTRGLASGIEYIGLGFAVGPHALGLLERPMITEFEPIVQVALGWLAFGIGLDFGRVEGKRVSKRATALGIACAVITGVVVGLAVWQALRFVRVPIIGQSEIILAAGAGAVAAETARGVVDWAAGRWGAKGPLSKLLLHIGAADDLAPLVATGAIFALAPPPGLSFTLPAVGWFGFSVALGALLGMVTAMLLRGAEGDAVWGALIGVILLVVGTAARFGLCTIFVTFIMGIALAGASPARRALRTMVGPTEQAVLSPLLLLAGAHLDPRPLLENPKLAAIVCVVFLARILGKLISGAVVRVAATEARQAGGPLGLVLLSSGPVSICCGFVFALRFPGPVGDTLLLCAVGSALLGELISTFALRGLLFEVGEISLRASDTGAFPAIVAPPMIPTPLASAPTLKGGSTPPPQMQSEPKLPVGGQFEEEA